MTMITNAQSDEIFDYQATAELFPGKNARARPRVVKYMRFDHAAGAIRFAVEQLRAIRKWESDSAGVSNLPDKCGHMVANELDNPVWYALIGPHYRRQPKVSQKNKEGAVSALRYRTRYLVFRPPRRAAARDNQRGRTCAELYDCHIAFRRPPS